MMRDRFIRLASAIALATAVAAPAAAQNAATAETFVATAQVSAQDAGLTARVTIHLDRYTLESDRTAIQEALRIGGYPRFLPALRAVPDVGYVEANGRKLPVKWARQQPAGERGRTISIVTDGPLFFVGGGSVDAKPRAGFEVAVIQIEVDAVGLGSGTMAAAARVRPGGATGVQVDDYAEAPVKLVSVRKMNP